MIDQALFRQHWLSLIRSSGPSMLEAHRRCLVYLEAIKRGTSQAAAFIEALEKDKLPEIVFGNMDEPPLSQLSGREPESVS